MNANETYIRKFENFIKQKIREAQMTQRDIAKMLGFKLPQIFLNKLHNGTFRSLEERSLAEILGYNVVWQKIDKPFVTENYINKLINIQTQKLVIILDKYKILCKQCITPTNHGDKNIVLSPAEQRKLDELVIIITEARAVWYNIKTLYQLAEPDYDAFVSIDKTANKIAEETGINMQLDIEKATLF